MKWAGFRESVDVFGFVRQFSMQTQPSSQSVEDKPAHNASVRHTA